MLTQNQQQLSNNNQRLVGVAAPHQRGSSVIAQAPPLHLIARTGSNNNNNPSSSSWTTSTNVNTNPQHQQPLMLDQWQQQAGRVPLASPEITPVTATGGLLQQQQHSSSSSNASSSGSSSAAAQPPQISSQQQRTINSSRFYIDHQSQPNNYYSNEGRSVNSASTAYPASRPYGLQQNYEDLMSSRPQTFHASANAAFPQPHRPLITASNFQSSFPTSQPSSSSDHQDHTSSTSSASTSVTLEQDIDEGAGNAMLDISSASAATVPHRLNLPSSVLKPQNGNNNNNSAVPQNTLAPLELVEQLNRILTVGDVIGLGPQQPPRTDFKQPRSTKAQRRAGFVIDHQDSSNVNDYSSGDSNSPRGGFDSPRDFAARRMRSVSMPLVQIGASSKFDGDFTCGERLARHLKLVRHFDLQSVKFNLQNAIGVLEQVSKTAKTPSNLNTTTGASAATLGSVRLYDDLATCTGSSLQNSQQPSSLNTTSSNVTQVAPELRDQGDGRCNNVVQSCPYFRNEISTEEVRSVHLGRATVAKQMQKLIARAQSQSNLSTTSPQDEEAFTNSQLNCVSHPICNAMTVLDHPASHGNADLRSYGGFKAFSSATSFVVEHHDFGAHFYRDCFFGKEHRNFMALHPVFGPMVISLLRERIYGNTHAHHSGIIHSQSNMTRSGLTMTGNTQFVQKVIVRTADMVVLRGTLPEDCVPSVHGSVSSKASKKHLSSGPSCIDMISFLLPELTNVGIFKHELDHDRVAQELLKIDEQNLRYRYKFGVIFCRPGQSTEEEFYNNPGGSEYFDDFLNLLGRRVQLRNFQGYSGGLDTKQDTTGQESVFASIAGFEVMFHVSTLLPFSPTNRQQLLRKRHIGNDVVTIIFQEPGSQPFTPRAIRSQYQHVFIVVRPILAPNSNQVAGYQVAISRAKDTPYFGPLLPPDGIFAKSREFGEFLLAKAINAENAVVKSGKFVTMALRTRRELLLDLVNNHSSQDSILSGHGDTGSGSSGARDGSAFGNSASRFMRLSFRRVFRDKTSFLRSSAENQKSLAQSQPSLTQPAKNYGASGAYAWNVVLVDCGQGGRLVQATLVVSCDDFILLDRDANHLLLQSQAAQNQENSTPPSMLQWPAIFCVPLKAVLGYRVQHTDLRLYYHKGESILLRSVDGSVDEIEEIVARIAAVAGTVEYVQAVHSVAEVSLTSPIGLGRFGFLCSAQGVVLRVDEGGPAAQCGLRPGCRIIEVFGIALRALTGAQLRELFQSAQLLRLSILPALPSGSPRQSRVSPDTPTMYWLPQYFHTMSPEFLNSGQDSNNNLNNQLPNVAKIAAEVDAELESNQSANNNQSSNSFATPAVTTRSGSTASYLSALTSASGQTLTGANHSPSFGTSTTTPYAQNRVYAELPLQKSSIGGASSIFEPRSRINAAQSTDSLLIEASSLSIAQQNSSQQGDLSSVSAYVTPAGSRRPMFLPATTASAYSNGGLNDSAKLGVSSGNNNNYQLLRWPGNQPQQTGGQQTGQSTPHLSHQKIGDPADTSTPVINGSAVATSTPNATGLLEAQLAVERSRRLAAEHELAEAKAQLSEMRKLVKQFTDWFITNPSQASNGIGQSISPAQRQKLRQWQSSIAAMQAADDLLNSNIENVGAAVDGSADNQSV